MWYEPLPVGRYTHLFIVSSINFASHCQSEYGNGKYHVHSPEYTVCLLWTKFIDVLTYDREI